MPFIYNFQIPTLIDGAGPITFETWILRERQPVFPGTIVARIRVGTKKYRILANGEGFLWKILVQPGEKLGPAQTLATIAADGEQIPYGKPYSLAEEES